MQRSVTLVAIVAALAGAACEDGPDQTFSPAPSGAAGIWNGVDGGTYTGVSTQAFDASITGGENANNRCTAAVEKNTWTQFFSEPISPPGLGGGLDIAGGPKGDGQSGYQGVGNPFTYNPLSESWSGMTVLQAEDLLCQGQYVNIYYGYTNTLSWGENLEFGVFYNSDNLVISDLLFQTGYAGSFDATSRDGTTQYHIGLTNQPISKTVNGSTSSLVIPWNDSVGMSALLNELYDAYIATFSPAFPPDKDCIGAGHCGYQNNFTQGGNISFVPLNSTFFVGTTIGTPQETSIVNLIDIEKLKILPFSNASVQLQLDSAGVGPIAYEPNVGGTGKTCKYTLGTTYADFDSNCVQVHDPAVDGGAAENATEERKLLGAISHDNETYAFDIVGLDPQFSATVTPTTIVSDTQRPVAADTSIILNVDQELLGLIANDYTNNDVTQPKDLHGIGLVTLEWAYLIQTYMVAQGYANTQIGDADCIANPANPGKGKICSGLEGIVTSAPTALVPANMKVNALGAAAVTVDSTLAIGLKPTTWFSVFCSVTGAADGTGYSGCIGGNNVPNSFYFDTIQNAIAQAYAGVPDAGPPPVIPPELTDRRFFFEEWCIAFIKYLETADNVKTTLLQIDANPVDPNELFFDSAGGGFENAEYVDRRHVNSLHQSPTTLTIGTNLLTSVINNFQTERFLYRSEKALYQVLTTTKGDLPGSENQLLSNMVGSPVLASVYGTYACAINEDPTQCNGITAPLDLFGAPLFAPYQAAFGQSFLHIAANGVPFTPSPMVVNAAPYGFLSSAMVTIPQWSNPYDPTTATANDPTVSALSDYFPKQPYTGFPVLIDGSRDKFYSTYEVDLPGTTAGGSTVQGNVDYEYVPIPADAGAGGGDGGTQTVLVVRAVETPNYLGQIFPCAEPAADPNAPLGAEDILAVRMYDNADVILNWIAAHPGAISDCGIYFKKSIYGNYFDFISFNQNGVRFGLNPGYGGSVVSDVTIFDPNVIAGLGQ